MVAHEAYVTHEAAEILPPGELARMNDEPLELSVRLDVRVREHRDLVEVASLQRLLELDDDHPGLRDQARAGPRSGRAT